MYNICLDVCMHSHLLEHSQGEGWRQLACMHQLVQGVYKAVSKLGFAVEGHQTRHGDQHACPGWWRRFATAYGCRAMLYRAVLIDG